MKQIMIAIVILLAWTIKSYAGNSVWVQQQNIATRGEQSCTKKWLIKNYRFSDPHLTPFVLITV